MDLVRDEVVELEEVGLADDDALVEGLAGAAVVDHGLAVLVDVGDVALVDLRLAGLAEQLVDVLLGDAVEDRGRRVEAEFLAGRAEVGLEELAEVHAGGHAEGVQHDVDRGAVGQVGHVAVLEDARDDALVAVAAGELVADGEVLLLGDEDADVLDDLGGFLGGALLAGDLVVADVDRRELRGEVVDDGHDSCGSGG